MKPIIKLLDSNMFKTPKDYREMSSLKYNPVYYDTNIDVRNASYNTIRSTYLSTFRITHVTTVNYC